MTIARPLQKPTITVAGTRAKNLPTLQAAQTRIRTPAAITEQKSSSTPDPSLPTKLQVTEASAPADPFIIPGRPPNNAQVNPIIHAACRPREGSTLANAAKATLSGICAKHTTMLARSSSFHCPKVMGPHQDCIVFQSRSEPRSNILYLPLSLHTSSIQPT
mmetsp:Transcript_9425/g.15236  ORF Transcript_9425/g.15236 Transcript_9425/m.15236 type:complete len:161 (+) Transcript_9425:1366-1848(+)